MTALSLSSLSPVGDSVSGRLSPQAAPGNSHMFTNLATLGEVYPAKFLGLSVFGLVWVT